MNLKGILLLILVSSLLIGTACAAGVNDFKIDDTYKSVYEGEYYSVHANDKQDVGICIYKNVDDDAYDDKENDDVLDNVIHHDGKEYTLGDDDMSLNKTDDKTAVFKDYEHATHGASEVVKKGNEEYIVVFWAKDSSDFNDDKINSLLSDFNKDNDVSPVEF